MTTIASYFFKSWQIRLMRWKNKLEKLRQYDARKRYFQMQKNGKEVLAKDYIQAVKTNHKIGYEVEKMFLDYDVLLSPVLAKPPVEIGNIDLNTTDFADYAEKLSTYTPFTGIFNQSGHPSISLPLYRTHKNLPVGTMLTASFGNESLLFGLARQLEVAEPWEAALKEMRTQIDNYSFKDSRVSSSRLALKSDS